MPVPYNKSEADPEYSFKKRFTMVGGDFKKWLQSKGLPESLGFVIRRSIHAKGIRPRRFFSDSFNQLVPEFDEILEETATSSLNDSIDDILNPLKN
jgi:hypothetical protein